MDFYAVLDQTVDLLRQRGRVTYGALKIQFQLDDDQLEALRDELLYAHPQVVDDVGRGLLWTGAPEAVPALAAIPAPAQDRALLTYTPPHLAEKILTSRTALEGERKQVTVLFADIKDSTELIKDLDPEAAQQLLDPAIHIMMDAVRIAEAVEQPFSIAGALNCVGSLFRRQGDIHRAVPALERSLALCQTANVPRLFPMAASILGAAYALAGRAAEALPLLNQTLERVAPGSRVIFQALVLTELSEALLLVGRVDEASTLASRLLEFSCTHTGRGYQAHACRLLGEVAMHREPPDIDQATAHYRQALALGEELGMRPLQAHCHLGLGTLFARLGQRQQAHAALSTAIDLYRAMDMTFWLPQAEATLAQVDGSR